MATKRPSYTSIRARQKNIIEGLGTSDLKYAQAAKRFGVEPRELRKFVTSKPKTLRTNFNRSPTYKKLYEEGTRGEVRETLGVRRIKRYAFHEKEIQLLKKHTTPYSPEESQRRVQIGEMVQRLYVDKDLARYEWAEYTREHNLPTSIQVLTLLFRNNKITGPDYAKALAEWKAIYNVSDNQYAKYEDELSEYDEVA